MPITPACTGGYWEAEVRKVGYNTGDYAQDIKQIGVADHAGLKDIWETELSKVKLSMSSDRGRYSKHARKDTREAQERLEQHGTVRVKPKMTGRRPSASHSAQEAAHRSLVKKVTQMTSRGKYAG